MYTDQEVLSHMENTDRGSTGEKGRKGTKRKRRTSAKAELNTKYLNTYRSVMHQHLQNAVKSNVARDVDTSVMQVHLFLKVVALVKDQNQKFSSVVAESLEL